MMKTVTVTLTAMTTYSVTVNIDDDTEESEIVNLAKENICLDDDFVSYEWVDDFVNGKPTYYIDYQ